MSARRASLLAAAAGLAVGASLLFLDVPVLISRLMVDDSFYYLKNR